MGKQLQVMLRLFCVGLLLVNAHGLRRDSQEALDLWIKQNSELAEPDPFKKLEVTIGKAKAAECRSDFDRYMASATSGSIQAKSEKYLKVLGTVAASTTKLKSDNPVLVLSGLLDIGAAMAALTPGAQPFAFLFTALSIGIGFAVKTKTESEKMKEAIDQAFWTDDMEDKKDDVKTWLTNNDIKTKLIAQSIQQEKDHEHMMTVDGLKSVYGNEPSTYGTDEINALWTQVQKHIDLNGREKTAENGLKVYNMIYLYVEAVGLRDTTLNQFKLASEMMLKRDCRKWGRTRCHRLPRQQVTVLTDFQRLVENKLAITRRDNYPEVGKFLEQIVLNRSAVAVHHHPIGWSEQSTFIHDWILKYPSPGSASYQSTWPLSNYKKKYVVQSANRLDRHIEPEDMTGKNDYLELEDSKCLINYAVNFEKINAPTDKERHGYFTMNSVEYKTFQSAENWKSYRYWRFYSNGLKLDLGKSVAEVNNIVKPNGNGNPDEYLFIVLEQEANDEERCKTGTKPKITIIPKYSRKKGSGKETFITYKDYGSKFQLEEFKEYKDDSDPNGWGSEWLLHDCQDKADCPACHSKDHPLGWFGPWTVDGRKCPYIKDWANSMG